jgi:hypothetical protein
MFAAVLLAATTPAWAGAYELSADELKLDCKRLTGRMQIRILQIRDRTVETGTSVASQAMQSAFAPLVGGSMRGADPAAEHARDLAQLEAYNRRLAEKGCRTFDLAAELRPKPVSETPRPLPKEKTPAKP